MRADPMKLSTEKLLTDGPKVGDPVSTDAAETAGAEPPFDEQADTVKADPEPADAAPVTTRPEVTAMLGVFALYQSIDACIEERAEAPELNRVDCHLLIRLDRPRRMGELARLLRTVPSNVTASADTLEQLGLIVRSRDPEDRRAWQLCLTEAGRVKRDMLQDVATELFQGISGLTAEETQQFAILSARIHDNVLETEKTSFRKE